MADQGRYEINRCVGKRFRPFRMRLRITRFDGSPGWVTQRYFRSAEAAQAWIDKRTWRVVTDPVDDKKARRKAQRADMDAEYDDTNPAGW